MDKFARSTRVCIPVTPDRRIWQKILVFHKMNSKCAKFIATYTSSNWCISLKLNKQDHCYFGKWKNDGKDLQWIFYTPERELKDKNKGE